MTRIRQTVTTLLGFDKEAEQAARFYTSVFEDNRMMIAINHSTDAGPDEAGKVMLVTFEPAGQKFYALN